MTNRILLVWFSMVTITASSQGQSFTNLNFEDAKIVFTPDSGILVATTNALPGWLAFSGTNQLSTIGYNNFVLNTAPVSLYGSNADVLDGNFSVALDLGGSISQTGLIPATAESLLFDSEGNALSISLGGQTLSYQTIGSTTNPYGIPYTIYGADIAAFAGRTETLTFSGRGFLDDIQFSPEMIPEPSALWLMLLGGGVWLYVLRTRKNRRPA